MHWGFPFVIALWECFCYQVKKSGLASLKMRDHSERGEKGYTFPANTTGSRDEPSQLSPVQIANPHCWEQIGDYFLNHYVLGVVFLLYTTWYSGRPSYLISLRPILSFLNRAHFSNLGLLWRLNEIILSEILA